MNSINKTAIKFFCLVFLEIFGFSYTQATAADDPPTELYVRTVPEGAKVFLNGKEVGTTPGLFKVEPGSAKIVVKLEGSDPIEREVIIQASRITRVDLDFNKQPAKMAGPQKQIRAFEPADAPISASAQWENDELVVRSDAAAAVRLFELPVSNRDQCIIIYRFRIKTDELKSSVYPEMYCRLPGKGDFFSRGLDQKLKGVNDWTSLEIPFYLKKGELPDLLKLNLVFEGPGTVRLKKIEVLVAPLPKTTLAVEPKGATAQAIAEAENILKNPGVESGNEIPDDWEQGANIEGVTYAWDKEFAFKSKASLCIEKTAQTYFPIAQWSQTVDREGKKSALLVSAQVKAKNMTKAFIDVIFLDEDGNWIKHQWVTVIGNKQGGKSPANHDWKKYSGKVNIPPKTKKMCVALQVYGPGKVWFDDVRASYTE